MANNTSLSPAISFLSTPSKVLPSTVHSVSVGWVHYWLENIDLQEKALKYQMIHFSHSQASLWTDSVYHKDPEAASRVTIELEGKEQAILKA